MQDPARAGRKESQGQPQSGLTQTRDPTQLECVEGASRQIGCAQQDNLSSDQKYDRANKNPALPAQEAPEIAIEVQDRTALAGPGFVRVMH